MTDIKRQEFEFEISRITNIIFKAQEAYLIVKYLSSNENDDYTSYEKNMNSFFAYSKAIYWQVTVIELSKLYIDRERFNLIKFLNKLKPNGHFASINISESKVIEWQERISQSQSLIDNLKSQRDKVYAHDDSDNNVENIVSIEDTLKILTIAHEIAKEINNTHFKRSIMFDMLNSPAANLKYNIERLVSEKKNSMEKYREIAKQYGLEDELPPVTE